MNIYDELILRLWQRGLDTAQIAERLKLAESFIANRLALVRDELVAA